jgi:hypothetical protein
MWTQLLFEQAHFALNVFAALVMFATAWLYFDAWLNRHQPREAFRAAGYFQLSLSFLIHAATLESTILPSPVLGSETLKLIFWAFRIVGLIFLLVSFFFDPIQPRPKVVDQFAHVGIIGAIPLLLTLDTSMAIIITMLAFLVAVQYIRRATTGLERHLMPVAISFLLFGVAEFIGTFNGLRSSTNVFIYSLVAPFGPIWIVEHVTLLISVLLLRRWVFGYLLKRFETQLFMVFTSGIVLIFLATAVTFTSLLLTNVQNASLSQLSTDVRVLSYALDSKKAETLSDAQVLVQNQALIDLVKTSNMGGLRDLVEQYFVSKKETYLAVLSPSGQVLARGEDRSHYGDTLSSDPLVVRAQGGQSASSVVVQDGVVAPELSVRSAVPIKSGDTTIGVVLAGTTVDNALLDGIKTTTGLESTIYGGNKISATTLVTTDGVTRPMGLIEPRKDIATTVLSQGKAYHGAVTFLSRPYLAAYEPLKDSDNQVVGMLFIGTPQYTVLVAAGRTFELTFVIVIVLLVLSVIPAFVISKSIVSQLH